MVAIRNLYWTEAIGAFIVGGLILARTPSEVDGRQRMSAPLA